MGLHDLDAVDQHLGEEKGQHADREHGQRHAGALRDELDAAEGQAEVDREARQGSEQAVANATRWFAKLGLQLRELPVFKRRADLRQRDR